MGLMTTAKLVEGDIKSHGGLQVRQFLAESAYWLPEAEPGSFGDLRRFAEPLAVSGSNIDLPVCCSKPRF